MALGATNERRAVAIHEAINHENFINAAREFKRQLEASDLFTAEEIAAMLGSFVQNFYLQRFATEYPPEFHEMMTKQNIINEKMLAAAAEEEKNA